MAHASFKKIFPLFLLLLTVTWSSRAQDDSNPVHWGTAVEKTGDGIYDIRFTARIDSPWHMYDMGPYDGGPNATAFTFTPNGNYTLVGKTRQESKPSKKFDPLFDMEIGTFAGRAVFVQQVKLVPPAGGARIAVNIEWMACDETSCLPPADRDFTVTIGDPSAKTAVPAPSAPASPSGNNNPGLSNLPSASTAGTTTPEESTPETTSGTTTANATTDTASAEINAATTEGGSLWSAIIEAILWGFAALLTPCVFPMVPMTVSFFLKGSENKARTVDGLALRSLHHPALYSADCSNYPYYANRGRRHRYGRYFQLARDTLDSERYLLPRFHDLRRIVFRGVRDYDAELLVNKSDSKADKGGIVGVFFMALTLVLVSFSCTGPIVGSVLIKSTSGEVWAPVITMFAFSAAFALPFTLFALFPSLLKNLPKSGGWLNSVKVVLGFLELALGLKFLSVADQTYHWGILDREIYLALWIVIFSLLGLYLLGKLRFAHDSETKTIGVPRLLLSIITFAFVVYMLPGMWGAPLKGLSGYLPPIHTQDFVTGSEAPAAASTPSLDLARPPKHSDFLSLPHGLQGFFDYDEAMAYARKVNKPLFVDYTGHGCVNCREMEARVWADPEVLTLLRNDFVIVALYSDDKKELPQDEWVTTETGKVLKSLGKINAHFAHKQFGINSQPYYMILNDEGKQLVPGRGYNLNIPEFVQFLKKGAEQFRTQHSAPETTNS